MDLAGRVELPERRGLIASLEVRESGAPGLPENVEDALEPEVGLEPTAC
jgi:hypothetical protein